jgi:DNA-binding CsgD family transcriptional regulator
MKLTSQQLSSIKRLYGLSPRQTELVKLLCEGIDSNDLLAERMKISISAVKLYLHHLYIKIGVSSKLAAAMKLIDSLRQADE